MALISKPFTFSAGAVIVASEHNSNFDTLYNEFNGDITNANISGSAAITDSKLAQITSANKVAISAIQNWPFVTGDWLLSSVTTARTGWTNVSATYSDKFIRINATPLTTGGTDTHTHTGGAHAHGAGSYIWTTNTGGLAGGAAAGYGYTPSGAVPITGSSASGGAVATGSGANVPAFVQVVIFEKD
jgi:hypothetical protein